LTHISGPTWEASNPISNYNETGKWMVYGIYVWDNPSSTGRNYEAQARGNITPYYVFTEGSNISEGQGPCKNNIPVCYVNITTPAPDIVGPELTTISVDKTAITTGEKAIVTVTLSDDVSVLSDGWVGNIWLNKAGEYESPKNGIKYYIFCNSGICTTEVKADNLPSTENWTIRFIQIQDAALNRTNYVLYDDPFWSDNPFSFDNQHYNVYNFDEFLPVKTGLTKIDIRKY
jgi:hypothetical protein